MKKLNIAGVITSDVTKTPEDKMATYKRAELIMAILSKPGDQGANYDIMVDVIGVIRKVREAIKSSKGFVLLETAEHAALVSAVRSYRYAIIDTAVFDFMSEVINLPDVEIKPTGKKAK